MTLVIATHNRKKAGEMITILSQRFPDLEIKTLADFPGAPEPEETGDTYAENAAIKALSATAFTGELCLADDAGLEIDALDGAPGHHSKRFGGEDLPFPEKMARILELLREVPDELRTARFRCCVAVAGEFSEGGENGENGLRNNSHNSHDPHNSHVFEATCEGRIAFEPSGSGGFGYDPIFFLPELGCCMADLTADQKHAVSHRGKVLAQFGNWLEGELGK